MKQEFDITAENQRKYYNEIAAEYDGHYHNHFAVEYRKSLFDSILRDYNFEGKKCLDAMCGGGENTAYLIDRGAEVYGVDISDEQCLIYASRYKTAHIKRASILDTGLPDNFFDLVVVESLHHLHPNLNEGLREISRLLKPGGLLLIWEPSAGSVFDLARKVWYKFDKKYFLSNEKSISLKFINKLTKGTLNLMHKNYGGNFAFLFVFSSMHFRIPLKYLPLYAPCFLKLEKVINKIQARFLSLWVIALYKKL